MPVRNAEWEVSVQDVKAMLDARQPLLLIDVREPDEYRIGRIDGAMLIPLGELPNRIADIRQLADGRPVVAHCHHGGRSLSAASLLREAGIDGARSMAGGIDEWSCVIDPSVPRY
jgi:rhodanese-related sulfurtransferase